MIGLSAFLVGLLVGLGILACLLAATGLILARRLGGLTGATRAVAYGLVASTLLLAVQLVPGALGVLNRWTVLGASVIALVVASRVRAVTPERESAPPPCPGPERWSSWLMAFAAVALVCGYSLAYLRQNYGAAPTAIDALSFHLPGVARWIQTGSFWEINQFLPQLAQGNYPNNGDLVFLALALPFKSTLLVRVAMVPFLLLTGVAVYVLGRELSAPRPAAVLFAAGVCAVPALIAPAVIDTQTDTLMLFALAGGVVFLLRHSRTRARADLVLAGLGLGIAFGTKWYGVTCVAVVLAVWLAAGLLARQPWRRLAGQTLLLVGLVALAGGFWLVRNLAESADPFFPARLRLGPLLIFNAPPDVVREQAGFTVAHYLGDTHVLRTYILPALLATLGWLSALMGLAALCAGGLALFRRGVSSPQRGRVAAVAAAAILTAIVYTITPETALGPRNMPVQTNANTRYLVPALILAAPLGAWLVGRLGRAGPLLELAALGLTVDALSRAFPLRWTLAAVLSLVVFAVLVGLAAGRRWQPVAAGLREHRAVVGLALLALVVAGAFAVRRAYDDSAYRADATVAWVLDHAPAGHRIGLAGLWSNGLAPIYPVFGPRLGNRVAFVGPFVRHMLQQYSSAGQFANATRAGRYDLLIVGRGFPQPQPTVVSEAWARAAGYREVTQSARLALFAR